jgi:hypothetical protein
MTTAEYFHRDMCMEGAEDTFDQLFGLNLNEQ